MDSHTYTWKYSEHKVGPVLIKLNLCQVTIIHIYSDLGIHIYIIYTWQYAGWFNFGSKFSLFINIFLCARFNEYNPNWNILMKY